MTDNPFLQYARKGKAEMRFYIPGEDLDGISVAMVDKPCVGGMIARNPDDHEDQWYIAPEYFLRNFKYTVY